MANLPQQVQRSRAFPRVLQLLNGSLLHPGSPGLPLGDTQPPQCPGNLLHAHVLHTSTMSRSKSSVGHQGGVLASLQSPRPRLLLQHSQRPFFYLPSPRQIKDEFFDPYRAATSNMIAANVVAFLVTSFNRRAFMQFAQNNYAVAQGEWWRLLTAPFLHSGLLHLAGNMLALHFLGPPVEYVVGRACFSFIFLSGALGGGLAHYWYGSWHGLAVGSSGAIAGLFSAWVVYKLRNRSMVGFTEADMSYVAQMVVINALLAYALGGSLSHTGHMGGLVGGGLAMFLCGPRLVWSGGRVVNKPLIPVFNNMPL